MAMLTDAPAIRRLDTDRADLFAVDIVGHVSAADVENLYGLLEAAYALNPQIDALVRLTDHDGVDWAEVSEETLEQGKAQARTHVRRCAAVGEPNWVSSVTGWFASAEPVELRHFDADEEALAWEWLGAKLVDEPV